MEHSYNREHSLHLNQGDIHSHYGGRKKESTHNCNGLEAAQGRERTDLLSGFLLIGKRHTLHLPVRQTSLATL